jgi:creatinine amidohydrolase
MIVDWDRLPAAALRDLAARDAIVLLPVASTEQHGPHLPTGVDVMLCGEVCRRAARELGAKGVPAVVAPVLWPGLAEHHVAFGGTFTLSVATWHAVLEDLCRSILRAGFKRILIVNGHGGNIAALNALNVELTRALAAPIASTTYFALATGMDAILEDQPGVMHACEAETSMMMALAPDLVDTTRFAEATGAPGDARAGPFGGAILRWQSFKELTASGVRGDARRASAEKGEKLFEACADGLAAALEDGGPWR